MWLARLLLILASIGVVGCGSTGASARTDGDATIVPSGNGGVDGGSVVDGAAGHADAAGRDAAAIVADAAGVDASLEAKCNAHGTCASCSAASGCFWCDDNDGCHTQYSDAFFTCVDVEQCLATPDAGAASCDANGTYVGSSGAEFCCSRTVDASGKCTAASSSGGCDIVCQHDSDCGSGYCSFSGEPVGCCMANNPACGTRTCASDLDCPNLYDCQDDCCWYSGH